MLNWERERRTQDRAAAISDARVPGVLQHNSTCTYRYTQRKQVVAD